MILYFQLLLPPGVAVAVDLALLAVRLTVAVGALAEVQEAIVRLHILPVPPVQGTPLLLRLHKETMAAQTFKAPQPGAVVVVRALQAARPLPQIRAVQVVPELRLRLQVHQ